MTAGAVAVPTVIPLRAPVPGQHKTCIDTDTKIELRSETPRTTIYYTINGDKPEPFKTMTPAGKNTYKYARPFRLPGGKRTLKAVAIAEDGIRESHVVSKNFDVEQLETEPPPPEDDGYNFVNEIPGNIRAKKEVNKFQNKMVTSKEAWEEVQKIKQTENMMSEMSLHGSAKRRNTPGGARHMNSRMGNLSDRATYGQESYRDMLEGSAPFQPKRLPPDTATQAMRLQRETDFLKCIYCFSPRPSDPYARFCNNCGGQVPAIPQTRMAPPEPGQMGTCVHCNSMVPFNVPTCVICEAPIGPQNQPQASIKLAEKRVCTVCGTANPVNLDTCITCEARLPRIATPIWSGESAPPMPKDEGRLMTCSKCSRCNNADARFCDWCGSKPSPISNNLVCSKCSASNQPYAAYCGTCGVRMEAPQRPEVRNGGMSIPLNLGQENSKSAQWLPISLPSNVPKVSVMTQTHGLFYPSEKQISKTREGAEKKLEVERQMSDRRIVLSTISPGRGYWRKQMDHILGHMKAHAENDAEFKAAISQPRMGKIISTSVHEDGYELSLTVNFALRGNNDPYRGDKMMTKEFLSTYTDGRKSSLTRHGSQDSLMSGKNSARTPRKKNKKVKIKKKKNESLGEPLSEQDKLLVKEVGKNGEGRSSEVMALIDQGADPTCVNKDGFSVLRVATNNKQVDAIPALVQEGADVNLKGPDGNPPLHAAVLLGNSGMETIDTLLKCGCNPHSKNSKGQTAYDLAVEKQYGSISNKFASSMGQQALDKLIKPRSAKDNDVY